MTVTANGLDELKGMAGTDLGHTGWLEITQDRVDGFADATDDHQWIHVDKEKAAKGPFGTTIAHGFLTLSLIPGLTSGLLKVDGVRMGINYGLNRVRFPNPVRVGSKVKATVRNVSIEDVQGGIQVVNEVTVSIDGEPKPACVAESVTRLYT